MDETPNLALPYLAPAQAQKHVTVNESLRMLDALVQIGVADRDLAAPPASPGDGARYIVSAGASGAWSGQEHAIAAWQDGAWVFFAPAPGWIAWVEDEERALAWDGAAWTQLEYERFDLLGVNATADESNRLTISSPAVLLDHEGGDSRVKVNKETAGDTASLVLQTAYSGRAEFGLAGDDDLHLKVSADGAAWVEALTADRATGRVTLAQGLEGGVVFAGADAEPIWRHDSGALDADAADFHFNCAAFAGVNSPHSSRANVVWTFGYNVLAGGGRANGAEPTLALHLESCYHLDASSGPGLEFHIQSTDTSGVGHRPLSMWLPHDGVSDAAQVTLAGNIINFLAYDGSQRIKLDFTAIGYTKTYVTFTVPTEFFIDDNNTTFWHQRNAAGSAYLPLPRIDAGDVYKGFQPLYFVAARAGASATFPGAFAVFQPTSANSDDIGVKMVGPTLTGTYYSFECAASVTGSLIHATYNNANDASAHARHELRTIGAGGGDPYVQFNINGVTDWSIGVDNSDSDNWKLSRANGLGSNDAIVVDSNLMTTFGGAAKLKSYAVAGVPSASTLGAGAMIYVSDEAGGAIPAFSDGTDWRRVTDRAVVS